MFQKLRQILTTPRAAAAPLAAIPAGQRVYAVGDIHGRLDLFEALLEALSADDLASPRAETTLVLLGDLIDRGPDSAGVIARVRQLQAEGDTRILGGNHEEMFLQSLDDLGIFRTLLRHGGRETALSFGIDQTAFDAADMEEAQAMVRAALPEDVVAFLHGLEEMVRIGDYLFVHAGINPAVPLYEQRPKDLRWIREPFLSYAAPYGAVVVHGHTITDAPEDTGNRIGIDTGAFTTGRLTALRLEGTDRRYIQTQEQAGGTIVTEVLAG